MPTRINLKELFGSDSQGVTVDKLNFNFNKMLELGVGTPGGIGVTGGIGGAGPAGGPGLTGTRGSLWYVRSGDPRITLPVIPGILPLDKYIDSLTADQYEWTGTNWIIAAGIKNIILNVINNSTSIAFVRTLRTLPLELVTNRKTITFKNSLETNPDGIANDSGANDMLFLNNFDEGALTIPRKELYTAFIKILPDDRTSSYRRFPIDIGSYYNSGFLGDTGGAGDTVTDLKHNFKLRHSVEFYPGANEYVYVSRLNAAKVENALIQDNNFNSIFEFRNSKYSGIAGTEVVGLHIWKKAFTFLKFGPATAMAWVLGFMLIGFTVNQLKMLSRLEFKAAGSKDL
jgi:hypothetical protein